MEFDGKVYIVTGGAGVIGRGIVRRFHEEGAIAVIADQPAGESGDKIAAAYDGIGIPEDRRLALPGDVADEQYTIDMIRRTVERFGRLDGIVTSVFWSKGGSSQDISLEEWNRCLAVTLTSTFLAAKYGVPAIRETAGHGSITAISSVHGSAPGSRYAMYATAKAGINMLVRALALDHTWEGVRFNAVSPGATTENVGDFDPSTEIGVPMIYQNGRYMHPRDIANAVAFLASDRSEGITGQIITVDGGSSLSEHNWLASDMARRVKAKYGEG